MKAPLNMGPIVIVKRVELVRRKPQAAAHQIDRGTIPGHEEFEIISYQCSSVLQSMPI